MDLFRQDKIKYFLLADIQNIASVAESFKADLVFSLDVIFHLVEEKVFEQYMHDLFSSSCHYVLIYSWDVEGKKKGHVWQRNFSKSVKNHQL